MLIAYRICLFLMSYDSCYKSLGNSESIDSYKYTRQPMVRAVITFMGKFDF